MSSIPQSLFWRRYTPDLLTTRIRKLSPQTKKVKGKAEQFTPLLEAQVSKPLGMHYTCCQLFLTLYLLNKYGILTLYLLINMVFLTLNKYGVFNLLFVVFLTLSI